MDVDVIAEILPPCMQHQGDADLAADPLWITAERQQRLRRRLEQQVIQAARIALDQRVQDMRQGEDQMVMGRRQDFGAARLDPAFLGQSLAFRAMPIPTGMEPHHHGITVIARLKVATHGRRSALLDRLHRLALPRMQTCLCPIGWSVAPEDIGNLNPSPRARRDTHRLVAELINQLER